MYAGYWTKKEDSPAIHFTKFQTHTGENTCETNLCEHICLLSAVGADGQSCVCQSGYILNEDQRTCSGMLLNKLLNFCEI